MKPPAEKMPTTEADELEQVLKRHPFLKGMRPEHLHLLRENSMRLGFQKGEPIFAKGDPANRFYLIESGKVALESPGTGNKNIVVQVIGGGDVLGWSWLFPPYEWHFDARAMEPTSAIFIYGSRLREYCEVDHELGYELMKRVSEVVIRRLQEARGQLTKKNSG